MYYQIYQICLDSLFFVCYNIRVLIWATLRKMEEHMKKNLIRALLLAMMVCIIFSLASCSLLENLPFDIPFLSGDEEEKDPYADFEGYVLIHEGKAAFNVVYTAASQGDGKKAAENFVKQLRKIGVEVKDAVSDEDKNAVTDREIIIGCNAKNRGDEVSVDDKYLGADGYTTKLVGNKIVVAGGTPEKTKEKFEQFVKYTLTINDKTKANKTLVVEHEELFTENLTKYMVESIELASIDMKEYTLVTDTGRNVYNNINSFRDNIYKRSGYWLNVGTIENKDSYERCIIIRDISRKTNADGSYISPYEDPGFYVYFEDGDLIVECAYANAFDTAFQKFANANFLTKKGKLSIPESYKYQDEVSIVRYEDFGAVGDGLTCDWKAIADAHSHANAGGQLVLGNAGANYFISAGAIKYAIAVKTDTDFGGATFTIDNRTSKAYAVRQKQLFQMARQYDEIVFGDSDGDLTIDDERFKDKTVDAGATSFPWLAEVLEGELNLVRITNNKHKDFIRHGANEDKGQNRIDSFLLDKNGNFYNSPGRAYNKDNQLITEEMKADPNADTEVAYLLAEGVVPVAYPMDNITKIQIWRADDETITIQNGVFEHICCTTVVESDYLTKYHAFYNGLDIRRSNTVVTNILHRMLDEPAIEDSFDPNYTTDESTKEGAANRKLHSGYGSRRASYPYYGFFYVYDSYNVLCKDSVLTGHTTYYEDKAAKASTGGDIPPPIAAGSYDIIVEYSLGTVLQNIVQRQGATSLDVERLHVDEWVTDAGVHRDGFTNSAGEVTDYGLGDQRYWGIMSSNGSKNINYINCEISRFDAHRGFWGATLVNTIIGFQYHITGGGYIESINVTKIIGNNYMASRGDYGGPFNGDATLIDCYHAAFKSYKSNKVITFPDGKETGHDVEKFDIVPVSNAIIYNAGYSGDNDGWNGKGETIEEKTAGAFWLWDFGYECYMPHKMTIDNFRCNANVVAVYNNLPDIIFEKTYNEEDPDFEPTPATVRYPYNITEEINVTYRPDANGKYTELVVCTGSRTTCSKLYAIQFNVQVIK